MAVSAQQIVEFLLANPNMSDAEIASVMNQFGVSPSDVAAATGADEATIQARYEEAAPVTSLLDAPVVAPIDEPPAAPVETVAAPVAQSVAPVNEAAPLSKQEVIDKLTNQILSQGTSDKWSGEGKGSAKANAADMASIIAETGATDIKQFGKVTKAVDAAVIPQYERTVIGYDNEGNEVVDNKIIGYTDQNGNAVDPKLVKTDLAQVGSGENTNFETVYTAPIGKQEVFGNTATGKAVANTYGERQTGDAFGGTYTGKGNTGYRVDMSSGTPVFYTTKESSNDNKDIGKFLLTAGTLLGLPAGIGEALGLGTGATANAVGTGLLSSGSAAISGADLKDIVKAGLVGGGASLLGSTVSDLLTPAVDASTLTSEEFNDLINKGFAEDLKAAGVKNVSEFTTNVGGNAGTFYDASGNPVVAPTAAPPVTTPVAPTGSADNLVINAPRPVAPPTSPTIANVISAIGTQLPDAGTVKVEDKRIQDEKSTPVVPPTSTVPELTVTGTKPVITAPTTPITPIVPTVPLVLPTIPPAPPAPPTPPAPPPDKTPSISDVLKVIGTVATIGGVANAVTPPKTTYPIVPIPTDWKPPTTQPTSPYQPLTPIDFGNQNLLKGTQWEKFLDPNYGKVPTPTMPTAPASNMSYSNLMDILGSKQGAPMSAGSLSINDIISGIQNQYGQTPQGSMGQKPA